MKSTDHNKGNVYTDYKRNDKEYLQNMNEENKRKRNHKNKVICSICLNAEPEDKVHHNRKQRGEHTKSCPICKKRYDNPETFQNNTDREHGTAQRVIQITTKSNHTTNTKTKSVQTVNSESKSMILLNEVLAEFQSKKSESTKAKTVKLKDASVSTNNITVDSKLSVNRIFQISIDPNKATENERFIVISSNTEQKQHLSVHKSSSIPQTQLEQLKHSLKVKHKSKDVIEEVNRMFATVNKTPDDDINRPSIRSGPKVLPVVQTIADFNIRKQRDSPNMNSKCCQNNCLSSGDSQCCHIEDAKQKSCDKCVFMMTCNYKNYQRIQTGMVICERCRTEVPWKCSGHSFDS